MIRILMLLTLCLANKVDDKVAQIYCEQENQIHSGYWECQVKDCSNLLNKYYIQAQLGQAALNFIILNSELEIQITGVVDLNKQDQGYCFDKSSLILILNDQVKSIFPLLIADTTLNQYFNTYSQEETDFNPDQFVFENILYCTTSSLFFLFLIIAALLFIVNMEKLNGHELFPLVGLTSIIYMWSIIGILWMAAKQSEGYYYMFFLPLILGFINSFISFIMLSGIQKIRDHNKPDFIDALVQFFFFFFESFSMVFMFLILAIRQDKEPISNLQLLLPFVTKTYLVLQIAPLFQQIYHTIKNRINNIEQFQNNQICFAFYLCFISLPAIFSLNFQAYYYSVFQLESDFTLLMVFIVLLIVLEFIIILQHIQGPLLTNSKIERTCILDCFKRRQKMTIISTQITYRLLIHVYDVIENCIICNTSLQPESQQAQLLRQVIETPCGHVFHQDCLVAWKIKYGKCPICNQQLPPVVIVIE